MFKNLKAEMAREDLSGNKLAKTIGITGQAFSNKMRCVSEFTRAEMLKIQKFFREKFNRSFTLDFLFELSDEDLRIA